MFRGLLSPRTQCRIRCILSNVHSLLLEGDRSASVLTAIDADVCMLCELVHIELTSRLQIRLNGNIALRRPVQCLMTRSANSATPRRHKLADVCIY